MGSFMLQCCVCRLSQMYCGKTVHLIEKLPEEANGNAYGESNGHVTNDVT